MSQDPLAEMSSIQIVTKTQPGYCCHKIHKVQSVHIYLGTVKRENPVSLSLNILAYRFAI